MFEAIIIGLVILVLALLIILTTLKLFLKKAWTVKEPETEYEKRRRQEDLKRYNEKYPLTPEEAFMNKPTSKPIKVNKSGKPNKNTSRNTRDVKHTTSYVPGPIFSDSEYDPGNNDDNSNNSSSHAVSFGSGGLFGGGGASGSWDDSSSSHDSGSSDSGGDSGGDCGGSD